MFRRKNLMIFDFSAFKSLFATNKLHLSTYTYKRSGKERICGYYKCIYAPLR